VSWVEDFIDLFMAAPCSYLLLPRVPAADLYLILPL